jgi:hypothetical protein
MADTVEYYNVDGIPDKDLIVSLKSSIVPTIGSYINIRKNTYRVLTITYAVDYADDHQRTIMRANVNVCREYT